MNQENLEKANSIAADLWNIDLTLDSIEDPNPESTIWAKNLNIKMGWFHKLLFRFQLTRINENEDPCLGQIKNEEKIFKQKVKDILLAKKAFLKKELEEL